jgi:hypothetical protein
MDAIVAISRTRKALRRAYFAADERRDAAEVVRIGRIWNDVDATEKPLGQGRPGETKMGRLLPGRHGAGYSAPACRGKRGPQRSRTRSAGRASRMLGLVAGNRARTGYWGCGRRAAADRGGDRVACAAPLRIVTARPS